ncbi:hypothetical protein [Phreatobacter stygius]|uniref:Uncharacterized protein n=1 Tax=Phreatobacter stygius TaxID=1940610 RepID=A0A4D7BH82_9HYPH|nr:hypothetical protein [Phreatobacter stygius]QCI68506.1 hypothetical protein E8M01_32335 [Phreatobacter stygius]
MRTIIPDLESRGAFTPDELAMMQVIYMSVCAERSVGPDDKPTREAIARTILKEVERGNWDVAAITAAARGAGKPVA